MNSNKKMLSLVTVTILCVMLAVVDCKIDQKDVTTELDKWQEKIGKMKPAPEVMHAIIEQLQTQCKSQEHKLEISTLNNISLCVEQYLNETQLVDDIKKAVPVGQLDTVFTDTCHKWPKVKVCLNELFIIMENCWDKGDKVRRFVEESVSFMCGEANDGQRIALFLAEGGLTCLQERGDNMKQCMSDINDFEQEVPTDISQINPDNFKEEDICKTMQNVVDCGEKELKQCKDSTPENIISSMIHFAATSTMGCKLKVSGFASTTGSGSVLTVMNIVWQLLVGGITGALFL